MEYDGDVSKRNFTKIAPTNMLTVDTNHEICHCNLDGGKGVSANDYSIEYGKCSQMMRVLHRGGKIFTLCHKSWGIT